MPAIPDAAKEAARVAAVRAALLRDRRWLVAIRPENFTEVGLRRRGQNPLKTGVNALALKLACRYADSVLVALTLSGQCYDKLPSSPVQKSRRWPAFQQP